jgi:hypothetical protein
VPLLVVVAAVAEHDHLIGNDFHAGMFDAFLIIPAAGLQSPIDVYLLAFVELLLAGFRQTPERDDVEPFRFVVTLAVGRIP